MSSRSTSQVLIAHTVHEANPNPHPNPHPHPHPNPNQVLLQEAVGRLALRCGDGVGVADAAAEVTLRPSDFGLA